jgi:excinuclease ABC subunit B
MSKTIEQIRARANGKAFNLRSNFAPNGDQPNAIKQLVSGIKSGVKAQTLLGVTGSGKTFTMANVIAQIGRPALVVAPNKTLAAQLYSEFREFFPDNRVSYFVSYYDYYQPEAYVPSSDTYIEKDSAINEEIDKMRHSATRSILESRDCIIVASVSCIYGLGAPEDYFNLMLFVERGEVIAREQILEQLVYMQYTRAELEFTRGTFRVRGEVIDIFPGDQDARAIRLTFFGDEIEEIEEIDSISGAVIRALKSCAVYPLSHFLTDREHLLKAIELIRKELQERLPELRRDNKFNEAQRLEQRTLYDLEMLKEVGFCSGIENYSRHMAGRSAGEPPTTLVDYFPDDFLLVVDESHVTVSQIDGMYKGDRARKRTLVDYGFRLPSALDNRPLSGKEFWQKVGQVVYVSATPANYELEQSGAANIVEQINRPTGLLDPGIDIRPAINQIDDLIKEIHANVLKNERVLVTTLTKKMSEDLAKYLRELGIKCRYLHSDIKTIERVEILRGLRRGDFDVLIGINLLREGLDLVEVSLVAILDADKEGFLRSTRSLIQTMGRAARNINGRVILYADKITDSIKAAVAETDRRRKIQAEFNKKHGVVPRSASSELRGTLPEADVDQPLEQISLQGKLIEVPVEPRELRLMVERLRTQMFEAAARKEFELAAEIRDVINKIQERALLEYV